VWSDESRALGSGGANPSPHEPMVPVRHPDTNADRLKAAFHISERGEVSQNECFCCETLHKSRADFSLCGRTTLIPMKVGVGRGGLGWGKRGGWLGQGGVEGVWEGGVRGGRTTGSATGRGGAAEVAFGGVSRGRERWVARGVEGWGGG